MERKILLSFACYIMYLNFSQAQNWDWALKTGNAGMDEAHSIGVDKQNNIYVTGGDYNFTGGGASGGSYYNEWLFKFDPTGQLLWKTQLDITVTKAVTDSVGNVYITAGNFIEKYNSSGTKIWTVNQPGYFQNICLHPDQGVFVAGNIIVNNISTGILITLDNNGNKIWEKIGDFASGGSTPFALATDGTESLYVAGDGDKDSTTGNYGFLAKYDKVGNLIYIESIPHTPTSISIDKQNNIYLSGWFAILPININGIVYSSPQGKRKSYILKYNPNFQIEWYKFFGGQNGIAGMVVIDKNNNLFFANFFNEIMTIDSLSLSCVGTNVYVVKFDTDGNIIWAKNSTGTTGTYFPSAVTKALAINDNYEIFIAGSIEGNVSFDSFSFSHQNLYKDMFVAKISDNNIVTSTKVKDDLPNKEFAVYPNPSKGIFTVKMEAMQADLLKLEVRNVLGQRIYNKTYKNQDNDFIDQIDISNQSKGIYFIEIIADKEKHVKKIVIE